MATPEDEAKGPQAEKQTENVESADEAVEQTSETTAEADSAEAGASDSLEDQLQAALEEVEKFKDVALRAEAEMQNMQRRTSRDVENAHKFGLERFLQNLLPVVDSIEKAIEASEQTTAEGAEDAIAEGVRLCHKLLVDVLSKEGVETVDPIGAPFDPNEHQAMSMVENPNMEPNSVFAVVQKGYKLNGRLVRPAMVMVTKAPAAAAADNENSDAAGS